MPDAATTPVLRKLRVRLGREVRYLWVEAETARAIENYDRFARRRAKLFRDRHTTNVSEEELTTRELNGPDRPIRIHDLLNGGSEAASERLGLKRSPDKPGRWEGPRVPIDRCLGESTTWTASEFGRLERRPYAAPDGSRGEQLVFAQHHGPCPVCRGEELGGMLDGEVVVSVACSWCGRTNIEATIARGRSSPR